MQYLIRFTLTLLLATTLSGGAWAKTDTKQVEYKRSDMNFYWKGDVLKVDPDAVILPMASFTQKGDSYFFTPKKKAPKEIYVKVINDWIEPITPPSMPASLGVDSDAMQIREPQGDVQVAYPSAPATFVPVTDGMTIPNGTVVKTGANGTAAVLFGGVDSARLIPNSAAAVQQTVTPQSRSTEVDLTAGAVFSKVGQRIGEKEDYQVHTPFGIASARGTDFVSVAMPARTDVWIASGTVQLDSPDGKTVGKVMSEGTGALKIIRYPLMPDMHQAMMASAETMTTAMNFIPMVNLKIKALRDKVAQGGKLTANEEDYLHRIKQVPCLIKLALVEPPAPPPPAVTPLVPPPVVSPVPAPATSVPPASPAPMVTAPVLTPIDLDLRSDGKVDFQGATLSLDDLKPKLLEIAKTTPTQPFVVKGREKVTLDQLKKVRAAFHAAKLKKVTVAKAEPVIAPTTPPAPATPATPAAEPSTQPAPVPAKPLPPVMQLPLNLQLRPDGKVDFQDATFSLDELKSKLQEIARTTPAQPILINGREKVTRAQLKKVVRICKAAKLKVTIAKAEAPTALASANASAETTSMGSGSGNASSAPATADASNQTVATTSQQTADQSRQASVMENNSTPNVPIETGPHDTIP